MLTLSFSNWLKTNHSTVCLSVQSYLYSDDKIKADISNQGFIC